MLQKNNYLIYTSVGLKIIFIWLVSGGSISVHSQNSNISLSNNTIALEFANTNGTLLSIKDLQSGKFVHQSDNPLQPLWKLKYIDGENSGVLHSEMAEDFSFKQTSDTLLILEWKGFKDVHDLIVTVEVGIPEKTPFSYWNLEWSHEDGIIISEMDFPIAAGIQEDNQTKLVVPEWMGSLITDPAGILSARNPGSQGFSWAYPGQLSMQFLGLSNPERPGFYAASHDPHTYLKNFGILLNQEQELTFRITHYTDLNAKTNKFRSIYPVILGVIQGDWISMALEYRNWALKQPWSLNSRLSTGQVPDWVANTALWVWNRGHSESVLSPALEMKRRLDLPVNVLWHWWHGASYDDEFPEYLPPREGTDSFRSAVENAAAQGVRPLVYMNELQWGSTTTSWEKEGAELYAVKDENGDLRSHVYNIFTGRPLTNMCITTSFWRNKYGGIAREAINDLGVGGIYMDQACISKMCYDLSHGHELGGGNYWAMYSGMLTDQIRGGVPVDKEPVLSGEGVCEAWLPYLDVFLALQVSRERYGGVGKWETIPLFQSVYHPYGITYGNYSSLLRPPYDALWPDEYRPKLALTLLPEKFKTQFLMEQARSFIWGMQPMISNYKDELAIQREDEISFLIRMSRVRYQMLKFLQYGTFMRPPEMEVDSADIDISKLSIYAGQRENVTEFEHRYPLVYWGAWLAEDNSLGIPIVNISDKKQPVSFQFTSSEYQLSDNGTLYLISENGKQSVGKYQNGIISWNMELNPLSVYVLEVVPD